MATLHIISGLIGAGKSTLARRLERELPAVRVSLDEWIMTLFGAEFPTPLDGEWWFSRCRRCSDVANVMARQALIAGADVVLDCGFLERRQRDEARQLALDADAESRLYLVRADAHTRWRRIQQRNLERGETFALVVTEHMFDVLPWEPPSAEELEGGVVIDT